MCLCFQAPNKLPTPYTTHAHTHAILTFAFLLSYVLFPPPPSQGDSHPIVPVMLGDARLALEFADDMLKKKGIYVIGFSFPVVPKGKGGRDEGRGVDDGEGGRSG